ncbi:MAG: hypothetical protein AMJ90_07380 [candidate division Zixibacteria bacterium SM23_73_2]|nr:MAG: hypothetical protein AMJ90_07380 [candidate division Zixibacteria bacterium SM23_73_2]
MDSTFKVSSGSEQRISNRDSAFEVNEKVKIRKEKIKNFLMGNEFFQFGRIQVIYMQTFSE